MNKEDYSKYYIQGSDHYLIPKDVFIELFEEMSNWKEEAQILQKQLKYLRSGEYINQLKFERDMLEDVVNNGEVSKTDKEFIDMTHRNTELLEENKKLKEQLEIGKEQYNDLVEEKDELQEQLTSNVLNSEKQRKEFITYLENKINDWSSDDDIDYEVVEPIPQEIFEDVLSKYKKIIGEKK